MEEGKSKHIRCWSLAGGGEYTAMSLFFIFYWEWGVTLTVRCPDFPYWSLRALSWHQPQPMLTLLPSPFSLCLLYANSQK